MLGCNEETCQSQFVRGGISKPFSGNFLVSYQTASGHRVLDTFQVGFRGMSTGVVYGAILTSRKFSLAKVGDRPYTLTEIDSDD